MGGVTPTAFSERFSTMKQLDYSKNKLIEVWVLHAYANMAHHTYPTLSVVDF